MPKAVFLLCAMYWESRLPEFMPIVVLVSLQTLVNRKPCDIEGYCLLQIDVCRCCFFQLRLFLRFIYEKLWKFVPLHGSTVADQYLASAHPRYHSVGFRLVVYGDTSISVYTKSLCKIFLPSGCDSDYFSCYAGACMERNTLLPWRPEANQKSRVY